MAPQDIPTIDITPLFSFSPSSDSTLQKQKELIGEQIRSACASTGFFRIIGHGFSQEEFKELMTETHRFFSQLKTETKMKLAPKKWNENNKNVYRGYFPASVNGKEGLDLTNPCFDNEGFTPLLSSFSSEEVKEKQSIEELEKKQRETKGKRPSRPNHLVKFEEPNPWPPTREVSPEESSLSVSWRLFMTRYYARMFFIGTTLLRGFALGLGLPETFFEDSILSSSSISPTLTSYNANAESAILKGLELIGLSGTISTLRLNYYPNIPINSESLVTQAEDGVELGCEPHVDGSLLTLLYQPETGGLQVHVPERGWVEIGPDQHAFVVNTGLCMQRWSGGKFRAANHRVRLIRGLERVSVPFFFELPLDTVIDYQKLKEASFDPKELEREERVEATMPSTNYGEYILESNKRFKEYQRDDEEGK